MNLDERILKYIARCPPAISGQQGSTQTFVVACNLYNGFALERGQLIHYLTTYNQTCVPPWEEKDLIRKADQAIAKGKFSKARGHLISGNGVFHKTDLPSRAAVEKKEIVIDPATYIENWLGGFRCTEADISSASPILLSEDWRKDAALLVANLFNPGENVNFVTEFQLYQPKNGGKPKANPTGIGKIVERNTLVSWWERNPMPKSEAGGWMRINPVAGGVNDENVTSFRHALIEFDRIPMDLQLSLLGRLPLPISAILTSGGKSCHAWVRVDCEDFKAYESDVLRIREIMTPFGVDRANKNPSRLSRLVGVTRVIGAEGDPRQRLLYLNPKSEQKAIL